jgi:hypothetical protein
MIVLDDQHLRSVLAGCIQATFSRRHASLAERAAAADARVDDSNLCVAARMQALLQKRGIVLLIRDLASRR